MAVKIRLKQTGKRNNRRYRVVVVDESKKRDGLVIEELGAVETSPKPTLINLNQERLDYWKRLGAQTTSAVEKLLQNS